MTAAMPPTVKKKKKLSKPIPNLPIKLKKDGGFQYSGTNRYSINPKGRANKLPKIISRRKSFLKTKKDSQNRNKIKQPIK